MSDSQIGDYIRSGGLVTFKDTTGKLALTDEFTRAFDVERISQQSTRRSSFLPHKVLGHIVDFLIRVKGNVLLFLWRNGLDTERIAYEIHSESTNDLFDLACILDFPSIPKMGYVRFHHGNLELLKTECELGATYTSIWIHDEPVDDTFDPLKFFPKLKRVALLNTGISIHTLKRFIAIPGIKEIFVTGEISGASPEEDFGDVLREMKSENVLISFSGCNLSPEQIQSLARSNKVDSLWFSNQNFSGCEWDGVQTKRIKIGDQIPDEDAIKLCLSDLPDLELTSPTPDVISALSWTKPGFVREFRRFDMKTSLEHFKRIAPKFNGHLVVMGYNWNSVIDKDTAEQYASLAETNPDLHVTIGPVNLSIL